MIYRNLQYDYEKIKFKHNRMLYLPHLLLSGYHKRREPTPHIGHIEPMLSFSYLLYFREYVACKPVETQSL